MPVPDPPSIDATAPAPASPIKRQLISFSGAASPIKGHQHPHKSSGSMSPSPDDKPQVGSHTTPSFSSRSPSRIHANDSAMQTPLSSPAKSTAPTANANGSPTRDNTQTPRAKRSEPIYVASKDFGPSAEDEVTVDEPVPKPPPKEPTVKRSDRKSKTDAISAMSGKDASHANGGSSSAAPAGVSVNGGPLPAPSSHPVRKAKLESPAPRLRFNTENLDYLTSTSDPGIPTHASTPRHPPPRLRPRMFGLEEAPTFYPTMEEFEDPMRYISWIGNHAGGKDYGIVKIVPPEGWSPECVLDEETFRFRTRVQRLNSLSADARASQNYLEQLQKFHAQQGRKRVSIPIIDRQPVDLYSLKLAVSAIGGFESVCRQRKWSEITRSLGYPEESCSQLSTQVKAAYTRIIFPFEEFLTKAKEQAKASSTSVSPVIAQSASMGGVAAAPSALGLSTTPTPAELPKAFSESASPSIDAAAAATFARSVHTPEPASQNVDGAGESTAGSSDLASGRARRSTRRRSDTNNSGPIAMTPTPTRRRKGTTPQADANTPLNGARKQVVVVPGAEEQMCEICLRGEDGLNMLLCDDCNRGYHMYCLQPPLTSIPKSEWYCPPCLVGTGHDYGFEDGETHSLHTFWQRAEKFKQAWWQARPERIWNPVDEENRMDVDGEDVKRPKTNGLARRVQGTDLIVSEDDVEREFWRLVQSQDEVVEVEYGADVHSTTHGSALPTPETHPLSPYAKDKWNLNNLPILPASLLQYIKSDISGMTVPWVYVGMMFSTFCWHNEDHFTYSINYQHWGETKTWYGVPGADAEKLEEAMKRAAPDLFETLPDLLFHLTTMMSPEKLKKEGVRVFACDQRANEFVITFPKAYHSGFNHGLNLNEAVNFALPDWIPDGLESTRRYQLHKKPAVFSHDQLIITVSQQNHSVETAIWLQHAMKEMVEREIGKRNHLREMIPNLQEHVDEDDRPEHEYQCAYCTMFCYLGQLTSEKAEGVACLDHGYEVCNADAPSKWTLRVRFSDEQLRAEAAKVAERAAIPRNWLQRVKKQLALNERPPLKTLKTLVNEGERIQFPLDELDDLKEFVNCANGWIERANVFLVRKQHKRRGDGAATNGRPRRSIVAEVSPGPRQTAEPNDDAVSEAGVDRSPEALQRLLDELKRLPFDSPEIASLQAMKEELDGFISKARDILAARSDEAGPDQNGSSKPAHSIKECEAVLTLGSSLNVDVPEVEELSKFVKRHKWVQEVRAISGKYLYYHEVSELLEKAEGCELAGHKLKDDLEQREAAGKAWSDKATRLLDGDEPMSIAQLEELSESSTEVAAVLEVAQKLSSTLAKAKELQKSLKSLHSHDGDIQASTSADKAPSSESLSEEARKALLGEARRILRAVKAHNLTLELVDETQNAINLFDSWRSDLFIDVVSFFAPHRKLNDNEKKAELDKLAKKVDSTTEADDEDPERASRQCICRTTEDLSASPSIAAQCSECNTHYHLNCIKAKASEVSKAGDHWQCPVCVPSSLDQLLQMRKSVELQELKSLLEEPRFNKDLLLFAPAELDVLRGMVARVEQLQRLAQRWDGSKSESAAQTRAERHVLRKLLGCPIDVQLGDGAQALEKLSNRLMAKQREKDEAAKAAASDLRYREAQAHFDHAMDDLGNESMIDAPPPLDAPESPQKASPGQGDGSNASAMVHSQSSREDRKRKRGKRAKLVFREEIGIRAHKNGMPIYCLCHQPESGSMIACDKCLLWFHTYCVRLSDPPNLGQEPWNCPMCCIKAERKYPQAEVRVKDVSNTDPDMWLDVRATLRSTEKPVSKRQLWTVEPGRRIVLHLENFQPAIQAEDAHVQPDTIKRPRLDSDAASRARHQSSASIDLTNSKAGPPNTPSSASVNKPSSAGGETDHGHADVPAPPGLRRLAPAPAAQAAAPVASSAAGPIGYPPRPPAPQSAATDPYEVAMRRNREGIAMLFSRGVTDAMLQRYYVGWDGRYLVHPVRDRYGGYLEVPIGEYVRLEPDDPDGARLLRAAKHRYFHDMERPRRDPYADTYADTYGYSPAARDYDAPYGGYGHRSEGRHGSASIPSYERYGLHRASEPSPSYGDMHMPGREYLQRSAPPLPTPPPVVRSNGVASSPGPTIASVRSPPRSLPTASPRHLASQIPLDPALTAPTPRPSSIAPRSAAEPKPQVPSPTPAYRPVGAGTEETVRADPSPAPAPESSEKKAEAKDKAEPDAEALKSARAMARRMRPTATDAEIDEMVKSYFGH